MNKAGQQVWANSVRDRPVLTKQFGQSGSLMWNLPLWVSLITSYKRVWVFGSTPQHWRSGFQPKDAASPAHVFGFPCSCGDILRSCLPPNICILGPHHKIKALLSFHTGTLTDVTTSCHLLTVTFGDLQPLVIVKQTESTGSSAHVPDFLFPGHLHQRCP